MYPTRRNLYPFPHFGRLFEGVAEATETSKILVANRRRRGSCGPLPLA